MQTQQRLLTMLGDGAVHSGNELAAALGVSRAAVWKQLQRLRALGVEIDGEAGHGYRLRHVYEPLDYELIMCDVDESVTKSLESLSVCWECDSTNNMVLKSLQNAPLAPGLMMASVADYQTGGRGRRGRRWVSPPGCGAWLSVSYTWDAPPADLPALSLSVGAHVLRLLKSCGASSLSLKWPNDLLSDGRKLGGILIDVQGDIVGPLTVVVGVGINIDVPEAVMEQVLADGGQPPIGLREIGVACTRSVLVGKLISAIASVLQGYSNNGFLADREFWCQHDFLKGCIVQVSGAEDVHGTAKGVDDHGYLILQTAEGERLIGAGDVTLRAKPVGDDAE